MGIGMTNLSDNCVVCGNEFDLDELKSISLSTVHTTKFKICEYCLEKSSSSDDYREVRNIALAYLNFPFKK
jgi:hypothetical protein